MDKPEIVERYREAIALQNKYKKLAESMKPEIKELLEATGGFDNLYYQERRKTIYNEDVIYNWISKTYPQFLDELTKKTVDLDKFGEFVKLKHISLDSFPEDASYEDVSYAISTTPKKEKPADAEASE